MVDPYITVEDAQTYYDSRLNSTVWNNATEANQLIALTMASNLIDRLNYKGHKNDSDQDRQFPRGDDTTVPQAIKDATCEIAIKLLDNIDMDEEYNRLFITSESFSGVRISYADEAPLHILAGIPSIEAWRLLHPFLRDWKAVRIRRTS